MITITNVNVRLLMYVAMAIPTIPSLTESTQINNNNTASNDSIVNNNNNNNNIYQQQLDYFCSDQSYKLNEPSGLLLNAYNRFIDGITKKRFHQRLSILLNTNNNTQNPYMITTDDNIQH